MDRWYHSGLEGYCKAAAVLARYDENTGAAIFGCDLFSPDRFDKQDMRNRTWTLSRYRRGRSNRPAVFEGTWLAPDAARADRELQAIGACVDRIADDGIGGPSALKELVLDTTIDIVPALNESILPAIAAGFKTEGYSHASVATFCQVAEELLDKVDLTADSGLRPFARMLVAALIYGPQHPLALNRPYNATVLVTEDEVDGYQDASAVAGDTIRLTQVYSDDGAYCGFSDEYTQGDVVFFGRSPHLRDYLERCDEPEYEEIKELLEGKNPIVFPVAAAHRKTSNVHGALARYGSGWYYYDLASTNGTMVEQAGRAISVAGLCGIRAGARICLGGLAGDTDEDLYHDAAVVLVSYCL